MQHGNIFIISAPSGAGKSSLIKKITELDKNIQVSISHTTRLKRPDEIEGIDYFFIDQTKFKEKLAKKEFVEHALVYGNYYGTCLKTIETFLSTGKDIILEIDWQGAEQIKQIFPESILIFILPPDINELEKRLRSRNSDSEKEIKNRLLLAEEDVSHAHKFDFIIINNNFTKALNELYSIIQVHHLKSNKVLLNYKFSNSK